MVQGWEFDHRFFDRINCFFLWLIDRFDCEKDRIPPMDLFKRSSGYIRSWSIIFKDWRDRFDHGWSFLKIKKIKRSKIERSNSHPCMVILVFLFILFAVYTSYNLSYSFFLFIYSSFISTVKLGGLILNEYVKKFLKIFFVSKSRIITHFVN